ncbi:hypothetical protein CcaCcLH18_07072 [Colletotrichum camelliae]|nr:hypothetical protein CcaCcLH18_07072 [Colletotrichum camelliae]
MATGNDLFKLYRYDPSLAAAIIFIVLFLLITAWHSFILLRTKTWFFIPFVPGGFCQWIGYIGRAISSVQSPNWTVKPYIIQTLLPLVAPALYAASIYMILGRIIMITQGEQHSIIRKKWLTKLFVFGDVISFILQAAGGGIMASGTKASLELGEHIVIGGLVVQVLFFSLFASTAAVFHVRMRKLPTTRVLSANIPWEAFLAVLYLASALIMIRSIFRLIEYAQGNDGYLVSHEVYLYVFDSVLMFATMCLFAWKHPNAINRWAKDGQGYDCELS